MIKQYIGLLLWTYSILGMTEHKHIPVVLPDSIYEHILDYLPAHSYARAHWSRYNLCSQEFYTTIVQAFLQSHFVPESYIDQVINQYFTIFCGKKAAKKQEFQEKIKRALVKYTEQDTREYRLFKCSLEELQYLYYCLDSACAQLVTYSDQELRKHLAKLKTDGLLKKTTQMIQKHYSQTLVYREAIQEHILRYGNKNTQIYYTLLAFFEPIEYLFTKITQTMHFQKAQICIGCYAALYTIAFITTLKAYLANQDELNYYMILKALQLTLLFFSLPLLVCCVSTLAACSIIADIAITCSTSQSDFIRYAHFLRQISQRLKFALHQAKISAQT